MRAQVLGLALDLLDFDASLARCVELVEAGASAQHVVINAGKVVMAHDNPQLADSINRADIVNADGMAVVWAGRFLGAPVPERVAGIDLMEALLGEAEARAWPVYFLGARREVLDRFLSTVRDRYPSLIVAGASDGYFADAHCVAEQVRSSGARLLFLGMSSPMKEQFVAAHSEDLGPLLSFGVGGSFDVWAGETSRAPRWMQNAGLEWLYRLLQEPGRMWKRYLVGNARFIALAVGERMRGNVWRPEGEDRGR